MWKAYTMDPIGPNSMKSKNPHSGFREVQITKTMDTIWITNPVCNQGGIVLVQHKEKSDDSEQG